MRRAALCTSLVLGALAVPGTVRAGGWQEAHQTSDDVRVVVGSDGVATIQHHLRYRVVAGRFRSFDVVGIDEKAEIAEEVIVEAERGGEVAAHAERAPRPADPSANAKPTLRIVVDEPAKGLGRGVYFVDVKYKVDLVATKLLTRDGAMWKLAWTAPPAPEGQDGARVVFEVPPAPTEPRLAASNEAATTLPTLRRSPEADELELVRAHVPRGEAVTWAVRVDPKAFPSVTSPELRPPPPPPPTPASFARSSAPRLLAAAGLAALAGMLTALLGNKQRAARATAEASGARARMLIAVPRGLGPFAYGAAATLGLAALLWSSPIVGALLVVVAMALGAHRAPSLARRAVNGRAAWRPVADERALLPRERSKGPGDVFDVGATPGKIALVAIAAFVGVASYLLRAHVPGVAVALPLASAALLPVFVTGTRASLPPAPEDLAARVLRPARDELGRLLDLSHVEVVTIARFVEGSDAFDEVRLLASPALRIPGLRGVELALAVPAPGEPAALPELLVRVDEGSEALARLADVAPGARILGGRLPAEKVARVVPAEPTPSGAARALARLLRDLEERRESDRAPSAAPPSRRRYRGPERRARALTALAAAST